METTPTFWLIDDDHTSTFLTGRLLKNELGAVNIAVFQSGTEALDALKHHLAYKQPLPDVIFLDINMPLMNGFEFLQRMADLLINANTTRVVILTTSSHSRDMLKAVNAPVLVHGFITKPLTKEKLAEIILTKISQVKS